MRLPNGSKGIRVVLFAGVILFPGLAPQASGAIVASGDVTPDPANPLLSLARRIYVGEEGQGQLTIDGGSQVRSDGGSIGRFLGSSGQVTLSGETSQWDATFLTSPTFHVGVRGMGDLEIQQGAELRTGHARIASEAEGVGKATIDGPNASWKNQGIRVGDKGAGELVVSRGGSMTSEGNSRIGSEPGGSGTVAVLGAGSSWSQSEYLVIGQGALEIAEGGKVSNTWANVASLPGSSADITVSGIGSLWKMSESLRFATGIATETEPQGSVAQMKVIAGAAVESTQSASVGVADKSAAHVLIEGVGSHWTHQGELIVGDSGAGTLDTKLGGRLNAHTALLGFTPTGQGTVSVTGIESAWQIDDQLSVGMAGSGALDLSLGARISSKVGSIATLGRGEVRIADERSHWDIDRELYVGGFQGSEGRLEIGTAGEMHVGGDFVVGYEADSEGTITLSTDGLLEIEGETTLARGENSVATLTIAGGGTFDADDDVTLALGEGSHASLNLEPDGELNMHGHAIRVGEGRAEFHIFGGNLRNVGIFGTHLNQVGGRISAGNSPGTMRIEGDFVQGALATLEVELSSLSAEPMSGIDYDVYHVEGNASLEGKLEIVLLPSYIPRLGDVFDVLHAQSIHASGLDISGPSGFETQIVPNALGTQSLRLMYVPEPMGNGLIALILAWIWQRNARFDGKRAWSKS